MLAQLPRALEFNLRYVPGNINTYIVLIQGEP